MRGLSTARILLPVAAIVAAGIAAAAVIERMALDNRAAERRALVARDIELTSRALAPGSALTCLDAGAGDTIESACEKSVFADAQSAAGAVAYVAARLALLKAAADSDDKDIAGNFDATRRAIALDRFGIAAHVLAHRDGCTPERCAGFALVEDAGALKANMKVQVFDQYVSRHAARWNAPPAEKAAPQVSEAPGALPPAATAALEPAGAVKPPSKQWDYPSAASIPAVSIMNTEPPRPKEQTADGQAASTGQASPSETASVPVPPRRPPQAAEPPAR